MSRGEVESLERWAGFLASEACKVTPETPAEELTYVGEQEDVPPHPPLPLYNCKCCKPARTYARETKPDAP